MCPSRPDTEDPRARYGLEPDPPEEVARLAELIPGADELHRVPLHPSVADRSWGEDPEARPSFYDESPGVRMDRCFGEGSDDEDGDA